MGATALPNEVAKMNKRASALLLCSGLPAILLILAMPGLAKDKDKVHLPAYVLAAHTVSVIIDPSAGLTVEDPLANRTAQKNVETALANWGRLQPLVGQEGADLIIVVRKGNGRVVNQTITDPRQNNRVGVMDPTDDGMTAGAQHGQQRDASGAPMGSGSGQQTPHTQTEIGEADDSFAVYEGGKENPLDSSPAWRYVAKDGLRSPGVPAVAEFRKALAEAEKAAAKKP